MADITITVQYEGDDDPAELMAALDNVAEYSPSGADFGLLVDGEHRDPDDPATSLLS